MRFVVVKYTVRGDIVNYRKLGKTGLSVSEIGMGCEGFSKDECRITAHFFDEAERLGINCFDLYTSNPDVRAAVGNALVGRREKFIIQSHIGSIWQNGQYKRTRDIKEVKDGFEEMMSLLKYETATEEEKDYAVTLATFPDISWKGHCMYCSHCAPCPMKIDVASVTKFLNLCLAQGEIPETVGSHYDLLSHHAGECIACAACESRCPFDVPIVENMKKAKALFGK